ncbi:MAG: hypothetical protein QOF35_1787 [Actinomycetota bacterium]|nr:hypothetical protein [Actinomycetota bacterium]
MEQRPERADVAGIAASTTKAVHGRDHDHALNAQCCHPHAVEVIYLGHRALTVCHDCQADSGFLPREQAERLAARHRDQTLEISVQLLGAEAS